MEVNIEKNTYKIFVPFFRQRFLRKNGKRIMVILNTSKFKTYAFLKYSRK